ncbi:MAG: hypothetical protein ACR2G6_17195 [Gemmatimonadaceae bacterium]
MRFDPGTLGQRIFFCRTVLMADYGSSPLEGRLGQRTVLTDRDNPTQTEFGLVLAHRLRRERPIPAATVSRWESDSALPDLTTLRAIGQVARVDPGWLAFGADSLAPTPLDRLPEPRRKYILALAEFAKMDLEAENQALEIRREMKARTRELRQALPLPRKRRKAK